MDKYLLVFNSGYNFTSESKKHGLKLQIMSLPEVLKYEKDVKASTFAKMGWKYDSNYESDVRQLFLKFKARVIGITESDLKKARESGISIEIPGQPYFILNPWQPRNAEVEKFFPPKKEEKKPVAAAPAATGDTGKPPEGLTNIREQKS